MSIIDTSFLTDKQQLALSQDKSVLVEACAGSGKTTLLVSRIITLLEKNREWTLDNILAITYTNKAAGEMRTRLQTQLLPTPNDTPESTAFKSDHLRMIDRANITTIHGFCYQLIRQFGPDLELGIGHELQDPDRMDFFLYQSVSDALIQLKREQDSDFNTLLNHWPEPTVIQMIMTCIQHRGELLFSSNLGITKTIESVYLKVMAHYTESKFEHCLLDYDDLLEIAHNALCEHGSIRHYYQRQFHAVLVDEFQDTNQLQWNIIQQLVHDTDPFLSPKLFLVGDRFQSIYGFRGADPKVFEHIFRSASPTQTHRIQAVDNFRSQAPIIEFTNALFDQLFSTGTSRFYTIQAHRSSVASPAIECALGSDQLSTMAGWIQDLHNNHGVAYGDIAILTRRKKSMDAIRHGLTQHNIPATVYAGIGLFEKDEILDVINLIKALDSPTDTTSWVGFLKSPIVGLSDTALLVLKEQFPAQRFATAIIEFDLNTSGDLFPVASDLERLSWAKNKLDRWLYWARVLPTSQLVEQVLTDAGAWKTYARMGEQTVLNIDKLISKIRSWEDQSFWNWIHIPSMLDHHLAHTRLESEESRPSGEDVVSILTIHAAKGLEFPAVILPELETGFNFSHGSPLVITKQGVGVSFKIDDTQNPERVAIMDQLKHDTIEEEKRLFYVACTRAKDRLLFVGTPSEKMRPSHLGFLLETAVQDTDNKTITFHFKGGEKAYPLIGD